MKNLTFLLFCLLFFVSLQVIAQSVSINETGSSPDASAMLDIQSDSKGVLIPRMTSAQRTGIASPADGLLVYDSNTASFWYRLNTEWVELTDNFHGLRDADFDTQVQVEESTDEDIVRFDIGGIEAMVLEESAQGATRLSLTPDNCLIIGANAGKGSIPGANTFLGYEAGLNNDDGNRNVFVGSRAGQANVTNNRNVFLGYEAGHWSIASRNTMVGHQAGFLNSLGEDNVQLGYNAGRNNPAGNQNTIIGAYAALGDNQSVLSSSGNTIVGYRAGYRNLSGSDNVFIGRNVAEYATSGSFNVAVGLNALTGNLSGNRNIAIGELAMGGFGGNTYEVGENIAIGYQAGMNSRSSYNVVVGNGSGQNMFSGVHNAMLGNQITPQNGSFNTLLGTETAVDPVFPSTSRATAIGYNAMVAVDNSIVLGDHTNGLVRVAIGSNMPAAKLHLEGTGVEMMRVVSAGVNAFRIMSNRDVIVEDELLVNTSTGKAGYHLSVDGSIACEELLVENSALWPDYVFEEDYDLMSINELREFIQSKKHLPGMPPASEINGHGFKVGDMQERLVEKVEELTLYILELESRLAEVENK